MRQDIAQNRKYNGVCVFDLDSTLEASETCRDFECNKRAAKYARKIIHKCKKNNMAFAINTARSSDSLARIPHEVVRKLPSNILEYSYNRGLMAPRERRNVPDQKLEFMKQIQKRFGTDARKTILFDDRYENVDAVHRGGFGTIHVRENGMNKENLNQFNRLMTA